MSTKPEIKQSEFVEARNLGLTVKEMSEKFNISQQSVKEIINTLGLPKRTKQRTYLLVKDGDTINNVRKNEE